MGTELFKYVTSPGVCGDYSGGAFALGLDKNAPVLEGLRLELAERATDGMLKKLSSRSFSRQ